jgi:hypothetical protein
LIIGWQIYVTLLGLVSTLIDDHPQYQQAFAENNTGNRDSRRSRRQAALNAPYPHF